MRADRDTDVTMDVTDDDIVVEDESRPSVRVLRALTSCPTKRVELAHYREAQDEARLAALRLLGNRLTR